MLQRFTERARRVILLSQDEARRLNRTVGPEHVLLAILAEHDGIGGRVLGKFGVNLESARGTVESVAGRTEGPPRGREVKFSGDGKKALEYALAEARRLKHNYIGTEHLLLGLFLLESGPIVEILKQLRLSRERVLDDILQALASSPPGVRAVLANDLSALRRPSITLPDLLAQQTPAARSAEPRNNVVMCRVNDRDLDAIDALVEAGARATRSDAAAWLIHAGIESNKALFDKLHTTVVEIRRLREQAQEITRGLAPEDTGPADAPPAGGSPPREGESHDAARILAESENTQPGFMRALLRNPELQYTTTPHRLMQFAGFLKKTNQIKQAPASWKEFAFENMHRLPGD